MIKYINIYKLSQVNRKKYDQEKNEERRMNQESTLNFDNISRSKNYQFWILKQDF